MSEGLIIPLTQSTSLPSCSGSEDLAKWFSYWEASDIWMEGSTSWREHLPTPTSVKKTDTIIRILESIQTGGKGSTYSTCDGIPRFRFDSDSTDLRTTV